MTGETGASEWVGPRCPGVSRCHQRGSRRPTAACGWSMSGSSPASPATIPPATIEAPVACATATPAAAPMTAWLRFIMAGSLGHTYDKRARGLSAVLGVVGVEAAAGVPLRALVARPSNRHSLAWCLAVAVLAYAANSAVNGQPAGPLLALAVLAGSLSHVLADGLTVAGVPLWWPFRRRRAVFLGVLAFRTRSWAEILVVGGVVAAVGWWVTG